MRRVSPKAAVIVAAVLSLVLLVYVFAGDFSRTEGPPSDRLTDRQAGVDGGAEGGVPADPWATLPGAEGETGVLSETYDTNIAAVPNVSEPVPPRPPPAPEESQRPAPAPRVAAPRLETRVAERAPPAPPRADARPSFNCRNARTRGEIAVCRDAGLASLDRQMASQFTRALAGASAAQRAELQRTRGRFLARRDACGTQACMAEAYRARMREIGAKRAPARAASSPPSAGVRAGDPVQVATVRPSFNCRYAQTRSEVAVCQDAGLAGLDRQLAANFNTAMRQGTPAQREVLERSRLRFLYRRDRCATAGCIATVYRDRMREVDDIIARHWRNP